MFKMQIKESMTYSSLPRICNFTFYDFSYLRSTAIRNMKWLILKIKNFQVLNCV